MSSYTALVIMRLSKQRLGFPVPGPFSSQSLTQTAKVNLNNGAYWEIRSLLPFLHNAHELCSGAPPAGSQHCSSAHCSTKRSGARPDEGLILHTPPSGTVPPDTHFCTRVESYASPSRSSYGPSNSRDLEGQRPKRRLSGNECEDLSGTTFWG